MEKQYKELEINLNTTLKGLDFTKKQKEAILKLGEHAYLLLVQQRRPGTRKEWQIKYKDRLLFPIPGLASYLAWGAIYKALKPVKDRALTYFLGNPTKKCDFKSSIRCFWTHGGKL